jgi:dihydroorotase
VDSGVRTVLHDRPIEALVIRDGRVVDPVSGRVETADLAVVNGMISEAAPRNAEVIDAADLLVCPGFWDLHVHLREPGQAHKETIATGTAAAAAGGFTFVACMPNTVPPIDTPETVRWVLEAAGRAGRCEVGPVAAITQGRAGRAVTDFAALSAAGAVAFSDDGTGVERDEVMSAAFELAQRLDVLLIQHCEYASISAGGVMHAGDVSARLALPGLDARSEEAMIERDLDLCRRTGGRYHVAHLSTARAVGLVRQAKARGLPVTAEVTPHHLILTHEACSGGDPNTKMHPPLRTQDDVDACRQGLLDGTIDCVATDHAPHAAEEKAAGFLKAPPGLVGLETAVGLTARAMIESGLADWPRLVRWFTAGPAGVLGRPGAALRPGAPARITLLNPTEHWTVRPEELQSKSRNTPFANWALTGRAVATIYGTRVTGHTPVLPFESH